MDIYVKFSLSVSKHVKMKFQAVLFNSKTSFAPEVRTLLVITN